MEETIIDGLYAPAPHKVARAQMGRERIDHFRQLEAQEEAERQRRHEAWMAAKGFTPKEGRP